MSYPVQEPSHEAEIASRRQKVAEMYLKGTTQAEIGSFLGVNQATVSRDLTELRKEWLERSINHIDQKKAIELAKLDRLEVTYWEAWERSRENAETDIEEDGPKGHRSVHRSEGQSGNPAFLEGVLKCIAKRCEILGLDAPKKTEVTGKDGERLIPDDRFDTAVSTLAAILREILPGPDAGAPGNVAPAEQTSVASPADQGG